MTNGRAVQLYLLSAMHIDGLVDAGDHIPPDCSTTGRYRWQARTVPQVVQTKAERCLAVADHRSVLRPRIQAPQLSTRGVGSLSIGGRARAVAGTTIWPLPRGAGEALRIGDNSNDNTDRTCISTVSFSIFHRVSISPPLRAAPRLSQLNSGIRCRSHQKEKAKDQVLSRGGRRMPCEHTGQISPAFHRTRLR